jgi:cytochrome P450
MSTQAYTDKVISVAGSVPARQAPPTVRGAASWQWWLQFILDPLQCLAAARARFGPVCVLGNPLPFWTGGRRFVFATGADYVREVLGQPDVFRPGGAVMAGPRGSAHYRIRYGIFAMFGEQHRSHRRVMQPPCAKPAVTGYAETMIQSIDQIIDRWRPGETLDMYREMRALSNWVAARILFGNDDFSASLRIGNEIESWLALDAKVRRSGLWINLPGTDYRRLLRQAERLETLMRETIERNRRSKSPGTDMISLLIRARDSGQAAISEIDLIAHAVILYAASFETTANALTWTLFLIAQHPSIASQLHDEIRSRLADWPPDHRQLDALPLLDGVVRETLRLMPPVAYTFRTAHRDTQLGELWLRDGDKVVLNHFHTHRDPDIFPSPNSFKPARWFNGRPDSYEYSPFSAGPRICLGQSFAQLELKLAIARIMQRFRLTVVPGSAIDAFVQLTLRPRHGVPMTVHAQDRAFAASPVTGNIHGMIELQPEASA